MDNRNSPENDTGSGITNQRLEFGGFVLEHDKGSEDVLVSNAQNQGRKLSIPIDTFMQLADRIETANWRNKRTRTIGEVRAGEGLTPLQKTGT